MRSDNHEIDYDAIIRRAHAMRAEAIADMARAFVSLFHQRKPKTRPVSA
jgi:uncharacterized protein YutE (UPF0331/DUF86 family)